MVNILSKKKTLWGIRRLDESKVKQLIADLEQQLNGFETQIIDDSDDRDIDIIASNGPQTHFLRVERADPDDRIRPPDVREYATLHQKDDHADLVQIITTGYYTREAKQVGQDLNVHLINANELFNALSAHPELAIEYLVDPDAGKPYRQPIIVERMINDPPIARSGSKSDTSEHN